ncbi:MAG: hypothetical protein ACR2RF_32305 [Geminicoccaceae bacterium]
MADLKKGKMSPSKQYREPGDVSYGSSANVRESTSKTYSKPKGGKAKAGKYASYS